MIEHTNLLDLGQFNGHKYAIDQLSGIVYQNSVLRQITDKELYMLPDRMRMAIKSIRKATEHLGYDK